MDNNMFEALTSPNQSLSFEQLPFSADEKLELGLINHSGEFTNLGLLLSDQCEHSTKLLQYEGEGRGLLLETRSFNGSLAKQIDDIMKFLDYNNTKKLKDTLVSAFVQRDYSFPAELLINVFSNRIEFIAMGKLTEGFSSWRNSKLLAALRRLRLSANKYVNFTSTSGAFLAVFKYESSPEQKLLSYLCDNEYIRRKEAEVVLGLKQTAAGKVLKNLLERECISAVGNGKNTKYMLSDKQKQ